MVNLFHFPAVKLCPHPPAFQAHCTRVSLSLPLEKIRLSLAPSPELSSRPIPHGPAPASSLMDHFLHKDRASSYTCLGPAPEPSKPLAAALLTTFCFSTFLVSGDLHLIFEFIHDFLIYVSLFHVLKRGCVSRFKLTELS